MQNAIKKIVITSGFFNPLHIGHINLIREAKKLGDFLIVIVDNDKQVKIKGSILFMIEQERIEIIKALRYANDVILSIDEDKSVIKSLALIAEMYPGKKLIFAKGGDRNVNNIPEKEICQKLGIEIISGVGGDKVQSSSSLLNNISKTNHQ
jgi:cytidyltransferase-like protein